MALADHPLPNGFCRSLKSTSPRQHLGGVTSWLPLLKHDGWSCWIEKLVSHPWGRATLVASQFTTAFSAHHPRPFFTLFGQVDDWLRRYFAGVYQLIDAEDMRMFIDRSSHFGRTSNLRALFYPVWPDDFNISMRVRVTGDLHRLNVASLKDAHKQGRDPGFPDLERLRSTARPIIRGALISSPA